MIEGECLSLHSDDTDKRDGSGSVERLEEIKRQIGRGIGERMNPVFPCGENEIN